MPQSGICIPRFQRIALLLNESHSLWEMSCFSAGEKLARTFYYAGHIESFRYAAVVKLKAL